ncbi:hypothetical protein GCM10027359_16290 [Marilutibacter aestuarii]
MGEDKDASKCWITAFAETPPFAGFRTVVAPSLALGVRRLPGPAAHPVPPSWDGNLLSWVLVMAAPSWKAGVAGVARAPRATLFE